MPVAPFHGNAAALATLVRGSSSIRSGERIASLTWGHIVGCGCLPWFDKCLHAFANYSFNLLHVFGCHAFVRTCFVHDSVCLHVLLFCLCSIVLHCFRMCSNLSDVLL